MSAHFHPDILRCIGLDLVLPELLKNGIPQVEKFEGISAFQCLFLSIYALKMPGDT